MATARLAAGAGDWHGELEVVAVDGSGEERTIRIPSVPMPAGATTKVEIQDTFGGAPAGEEERRP